MKSAILPWLVLFLLIDFVFLLKKKK